MARNLDTPFIKGVEAELSADPKVMAPIERAARALVSWELGLSDHATNQNRYGANLDERYAEVERRWPDKVDQARIMLAAIREPSEAMKEGVEFAELTLSPGGEDSFDYLSKENAADVWRGMIDAALAEGA